MRTWFGGKGSLQRSLSIGLPVPTSSRITKSRAGESCDSPVKTSVCPVSTSWSKRYNGASISMTLAKGPAGTQCPIYIKSVWAGRLKPIVHMCSSVNNMYIHNIRHYLQYTRNRSNIFNITEYECIFCICTFLQQVDTRVPCNGSDGINPRYTRCQLSTHWRNMFLTTNKSSTKVHQKWNIIKYMLK